MTFELAQVAGSLAEHLAPALPGTAFYEGPNRQGTALPGMFIQQRYSRIQLRQAGRWLRTVGFELTYLEDGHGPELWQRYEAAADVLDLMLETFLYRDREGEAVLLRTGGREWSVEADALRYRFEIQVWVKAPELKEKMGRLEYHQRIKKEME